MNPNQGNTFGLSQQGDFFPASSNPQSGLSTLTTSGLGLPNTGLGSALPMLNTAGSAPGSPVNSLVDSGPSIPVNPVVPPSSTTLSMLGSGPSIPVNSLAGLSLGSPPGSPSTALPTVSYAPGSPSTALPTVSSPPGSPRNSLGLTAPSSVPLGGSRKRYSPVGPASLDGVARVGNMPVTSPVRTAADPLEQKLVNEYNVFPELVPFVLYSRDDRVAKGVQGASDRENFERDLYNGIVHFVMGNLDLTVDKSLSKKSVYEMLYVAAIAALRYLYISFVKVTNPGVVTNEWLANIGNLLELTTTVTKTIPANSPYTELKDAMETFGSHALVYIEKGNLNTPYNADDEVSGRNGEQQAPWQPQLNSAAGPTDQLGAFQQQQNRGSERQDMKNYLAQQSSQQQKDSNSNKTEDQSDRI